VHLHPCHAVGSERSITEEFKMKKLVLALSALAAFTGSAIAADLPARTYSKAPAVVAAPSWTGFYVFGGAGGGMWTADTNVVTFPGLVGLTRDQRMGGNGWFGTVGAG
jgi:outer membrane immunogenic protein